MRLTRFSDIGLRVLIYLARSGTRPGPVTVAEIGEQFDIPVNHLVKVVGHLARAGWVRATRGRNGGLRLAADPATLHIGHVLRDLEGDHELIDCVGTGCTLALDCQLREALRSAKNAFYDSMNRHSLQDITGGNTGERIIQMHRVYLTERSSMPLAS